MTDEDRALTKAILADAQKVGSMLSWYDHGGGDDAMAETHRAEARVAENTKALSPAFREAHPDVMTAIERFAAHPFTRWSDLEDVLAALE
jgi:hypothetical protein